MALFIGRLTEVKGVRQLAAAWGAVATQRAGAWLVVLGAGELEQELRETFARSEGADRVVMRTEFIDEEERIAHYAASDVVVVPSTYEPFGLVAAEAMACGKPAVVGAQGVVGFPRASGRGRPGANRPARQRWRPGRHRLGRERSPAGPRPARRMGR